jgi:hypothetical protein
MTKYISTNNTISNTRLLSLLVITSFIALAFVLNGGKHIHDNQLKVMNKPAEGSSMYNTKTFFEKKPVMGTTAQFHVDQHALVLSI